MLLFTFISCNHSTSGPQDVIRKITIIGDYSLAGIPSEVKNGTVITFPEKIINGSVNWKDGDPSSKKIIGGKIVGVECNTEEKVNIL